MTDDRPTLDYTSNRTPSPRRRWSVLAVLACPLGLFAIVGLNVIYRSLGVPPKYAAADVAAMVYLWLTLAVCVAGIVSCVSRKLRGVWFAVAGFLFALFWMWLVFWPKSERLR
jgi:hypothetical protein